jgi:type III restriction enzyme
LALRIAELRDKASTAAFSQLVLDGGWALEAGPSHAFHFDPTCYPVPTNKRYRGKFRFKKHFYPVLSDLEDGSEEWLCAVALDSHPLIKRWVRNLDSDPVAGFWLPTSHGRFYPDFVCEMDDGRLFVVEYKGAHLRHLPREIEKGEVGLVWSERSKGRALFSMIFKEDRGLSLAGQLDRVLVGA